MPVKDGPPLLLHLQLPPLLRALHALQDRVRPRPEGGGGRRRASVLSWQGEQGVSNARHPRGAGTAALKSGLPEGPASMGQWLGGTRGLRAVGLGPGPAAPPASLTLEGSTETQPQARLVSTDSIMSCEETHARGPMAGTRLDTRTCWPDSRETPGTALWRPGAQPAPGRTVSGRDGAGRGPPCMPSQAPPPRGSQPPPAAPALTLWLSKAAWSPNYHLPASEAPEPAHFLQDPS